MMVLYVTMEVTFSKREGMLLVSRAFPSLLIWISKGYLLQLWYHKLGGGASKHIAKMSQEILILVLTSTANVDPIIVYEDYSSHLDIAEG